MKDIIYDEFQDKVDQSLKRHANVLDIISKLDESTAKVNRSTIKSITQCGCLSISKEDLESENPLEHLSKNQLEGQLCPVCRDKIKNELGNHMFYIFSLCSAIDINLYDVLLEEYRKLTTLGKYSLY